MSYGIAPCHCNILCKHSDNFKYLSSSPVMSILSYYSSSQRPNHPVPSTDGTVGGGVGGGWLAHFLLVSSVPGKTKNASFNWLYWVLFHLFSSIVDTLRTYWSHFVNDFMMTVGSFISYLVWSPNQSNFWIFEWKKILWWFTQPQTRKFIGNSPR